MSFKKIVLTSLLLTALNTNADNQNTQQILAVDIQLIRLQKELELAERNFNECQNKVTTATEQLAELLRNNDQPRTATEQKQYDEEFAKLSSQIAIDELYLTCAGYRVRDAKQNLYEYQHPTTSVMTPVVAGAILGAAVLGTAAGVSYLISK